MRFYRFIYVDAESHLDCVALLQLKEWSYKTELLGRTVVAQLTRARIERESGSQLIVPDARLAVRETPEATRSS